MSHKKRIFMIAGPNGAGKTTTARSIIKRDLNHLEIYEFINLVINDKKIWEIMQRMTNV